MLRLGSREGSALAAVLALTLPPALMMAVVLGTLPLTSPPATEAPRTARPAPDDTFRLRSLDRDCAECHAEAADGFRDTAHGILLHGGIYQGCGTCHEGSPAHALEGTAKSMTSITPGPKADALCRTCHLGGSDHVREWPNHEYADKNPSCLGCHPIHEKKSGARALPSLIASSEYLGTEGCALCHARKLHELAATDHAALQTPATPEEGCESCHGPGAEHFKSGGDRSTIRNLRRIDAEEADAVCSGCHQAEIAEHQEEVEAFQARGLRCTSCHPVHHVDRDRDAQAGWPSLELALREAEPAGDARCADCHPEPHKGFERSFHASLQGKGACESCHGPATLHIGFGGSLEHIVRPASLDGRRSAEVCTSCHAGQEALHSWDSGTHARSGVSCLDCHPSNGEQGSPLGERSQAEVCGKCHASVVSQFRLPNHHRVLEGDLHCTSCHDPHGGRRRAFDRKLVDESCVSCHREREGPFVYEHEADRADGCVICHQPHGSPNRKLLTRARSRDLCLQCHGALPLSHDQRPGSTYRNCVQCHTEFHGSNLHPLFLR
ncbi:MAG: cytochrome c3 family protein [Planctomycetota bacterium]